MLISKLTLAQNIRAHISNSCFWLNCAIELANELGDKELVSKLTVVSKAVKEVYEHINDKLSGPQSKG